MTQPTSSSNVIAVDFGRTSARVKQFPPSPPQSGFSIDSMWPEFSSLDHASWLSASGKVKLPSGQTLLESECLELSATLKSDLQQWLATQTSTPSVETTSVGSSLSSSTSKPESRSDDGPGTWLSSMSLSPSNPNRRNALRACDASGAYFHGAGCSPDLSCRTGIGISGASSTSSMAANDSDAPKPST